MTALVLAGGGVAGIAWEIGLLAGLRDAEPDAARRLLSAELVVGTSAGSVVGAYVAGGRDLDEVYRLQLDGPPGEITPNVDMPAFFDRLGAETAAATDLTDAARRVGALAVDASTVSEERRREVIVARLAGLRWPDRRLLVTAVDCATGERRVFDRDGDVDLVTAVAASCAVPGVWPPVTVGTARYTDGGVHSPTNADLAREAGAVVVVSPLPEAAVPFGGGLAAELAGAPRSLVVRADEDSVASFGANPLAVSTTGPAARLGRVQGRRVGSDLAAFLADA